MITNDQKFQWRKSSPARGLASLVKDLAKDADVSTMGCLLATATISGILSAFGVLLIVLLTFFILSIPPVFDGEDLGSSSSSTTTKTAVPHTSVAPKAGSPTAGLKIPAPKPADK